MLKKIFNEIKILIQKEVESYYAERLVSLVFFGSAARGTQRVDSDLDLLVIANDLPSGRMKRVAEFETIENRLAPFLEECATRGYRVSLSPVFKSRNEAEGGSPLFLDMVEDADIVWDRDDFFLNILDNLKRRLAALGAKRVWRGNAWYWDLKPDFKAGEIIEL